MKKPKPSGMRKYWPHLTLKQAEAERQKISDRQGTKCAICGKPESSFAKRLAVDHRHSDGLVRGLLCWHDNKFKVGRFTLKTILPVVLYLVQHETSGELRTKYMNILDELRVIVNS